MPNFGAAACRCLFPPAGQNCRVDQKGPVTWFKSSLCWPPAARSFSR